MTDRISATWPLERHELPDGGAVFYRDSDHAYFREAAKRGGEWAGKGRLTGISTVAGPFDFRPDSLMRWAARSNGEGVAMLAAEALSSCEDVGELRSALGWLGSADSIWQALTDAGATYEDLRDARATEGTNVHKHALHALATGRPVPDLSALTAEERGHARGVMACWHECEPETEASEYVVADLGLGVAGRPDWRGTVLFNGLRHRALMDLKTGGVFNRAHVQVAGYERTSVACGWEPTEVQLILKVDEDGGWELVPCEADAEDFEASVVTYRRAGKLGSRTRAAYRAREALKEAAA